MSQISEANKSIAKNTLFLYFRFLLVAFITFYTSRVILEQLGVVDFGIFNVVGGIVFVFGLMQSIMASAISRFFMIELGRNDHIKLNQYFSMSIIIITIIAIVVILLSETFGLWFLNNKLLIPENRINAANWVYQFSILSFIFNLYSIPYLSLLIAREQMKVYAYIGFVEVAMKLVIAFLLNTSVIDKLVLYSSLTSGTILAIFLANYFYCRSNFNETKFNWFWNKHMFKEMMGYSIWSLFGAVSGVARNQGINIMLSIFFNPTVNAARAIAFQVNEGINQFSNNFFTAVKPQITKKFAANDSNSMMNLVDRSSRFSFYLLLLFALPIILETQFILDIWLSDPPNYSSLFTRLVVLTTLVDALGYPLMTAINATGDIMLYQICTGGTLILTLPISYIFLKLGYPPESTMYVALFISIAAHGSRIIFMKILHNISILKYFQDVVLVVLMVFVFSTIIPFIVMYSYPTSNIRFLLVLVLSIISCFTCIYTFGITKLERSTLNKIILTKIKKR